MQGPSHPSLSKEKKIGGLTCLVERISFVILAGLAGSARQQILGNDKADKRRQVRKYIIGGEQSNLGFVARSSRHGHVKGATRFSSLSAAPRWSDERAGIDDGRSGTGAPSAKSD